MSTKEPPGEPSRSDGESSDEKSYWLDRPSTHNLIAIALVAICVAVVIGDFFYEQHGHFDYDKWNGFYAIFGFVAYVCIVQTAKILREFVQRDEDYYGE